MAKVTENIQRLKTLNFNFTGVANEEISDTIELDPKYDRIVGIALLSNFYKDPSEASSMSFDGKNDMFPRGILSSYFQSSDIEYVPVMIDNMAGKKVEVTLKDLQGTARKVQMVIYSEKIKEKDKD